MRDPAQIRNYAMDLIAASNKQTDRLVYKLYGLTEEEIAVVEGGA